MGKSNMHEDQFQVHAEAEQRHWWFRARRSIIRQLVASVMPPNKDRLILDVGCGTGANAAALNEDYECIGIDTSPHAIGLAKQRFPETHFVCGVAPTDIQELCQRADLYLMTDVLEHIEDDFGALARLVQHARPGSHFLLTVPADPSLWSGHDESHGHFRRYDRHSFSKLWKDLPMRERFCTYMNSRLFPAIKCVRTVNRWLGRTAGHAGTDVAVPHPWVNEILEQTFRGESVTINRLIDHPDRHGYKWGVSLIALLERSEGLVPSSSQQAA